MTDFFFGIIARIKTQLQVEFMLFLEYPPHKLARNSIVGDLGTPGIAPVEMGPSRCSTLGERESEGLRSVATEHSRASRKGAFRLSRK